MPEPGNPQDLNRFTYCRNRPLYYIDPTGHAWWIPVGFAVGAVVGAGIGYGAQVISNRSRGMDWGQALTTDIDPGKVVQGAFAGAIVRTWVATGVGLVATGATAAGAGAAGGVATGVATAVVADDGGAAEFNAAQSIVRGADVGVGGFGRLARAGEFGIESYSKLQRLTAHSGLRVHHIIEKRFATLLGLRPGSMKSVVLTIPEHAEFCQRWLERIGRDNMLSEVTTSRATREYIWKVAQEIYADYPALLQAARETLGM